MTEPTPDEGLETLKDNKVYKLTIKERMYLLQALPPSGNYADVCVVKGIADRVDIKDEESKKYGIKPVQGGLATDPKFDDLTFEYTFSEKELGAIKKAFEQMESIAQINVGNANLYKAFVVEA